MSAASFVITAKSRAVVVSEYFQRMGCAFAEYDRLSGVSHEMPGA